MELDKLTPSELESFDYVMGRLKLMGYNDISAQELAEIIRAFTGLLLTIDEAFNNLSVALRNIEESMYENFKPLYEECGDEDDVFESYWWNDKKPRPVFIIKNNYFKNQDFITRSIPKQINLARRMV